MTQNVESNQKRKVSVGSLERNIQQYFQTKAYIPTVSSSKERVKVAYLREVIIQVHYLRYKGYWIVPQTRIEDLVVLG